MELRMYGLVNYQLTGIQQGIQFGHAVVEYGQEVKSFDLINNIELNKYNDWADSWKTFIVLGGGTTNINPDRLGTLNQHLQTLKDNNILCSPFYEPDLGDQLTSIVFIVDERVFNREKYPDFIDWYILNVDVKEAISNGLNSSFRTATEFAKFTEKMIVDKTVSSLKCDQVNYDKWVNFVGGQKNVFLRSFLKNFRLA